MELISLISISEKLMEAEKKKEKKGGNLPFRVFLDLGINYLLEVGGIHITVFVLLFKFQEREEFDPVWGKRG